MGIFDKLKTSTPLQTGAAAQGTENRSETFVFSALPESLAQMQALPQADLSTPYKTAALTVCALCAYAADKQVGTDMLNWLRGPRPLGGHEISFLNDRFRGERTYIPFSYFSGATPENNYTPSQPFTLTVLSNQTSKEEDGYCKLFIPSGGADSPRPIRLRMKGDGRWFLWEQYLLTDIRKSNSLDPWA